MISASVLDSPSLETTISDEDLVSMICDCFGRREDIGLFERVLNEGRLELIGLGRTRRYAFFYPTSGVDYVELMELILRKSILCKLPTLVREKAKSIFEVFKNPNTPRTSVRGFLTKRDFLHSRKKLAGFYWEVV